MRVETITSAQNPKIKNLLLLQEKSKARREQGLFVVEGRRELEHCLEAGFNVRTVFVCPEVMRERWPVGAGHDDSPSSLSDVIPGLTGNLVEIPEALYRKVAYREGTEGVLAEVEVRERHLEDLALSEHPLVMVLESVEKPGNLGAVLRSADAARADAVIVCDPLTDLWNPNLIRASIGAVFTVPTVCASSAETIDWLKSRGIRILTAQLQDSSWYYDTDMTGGSDGYRIHRSYRCLAPRRRCAHPHPDARPPGQSQCLCLRRHPPLRGRPAAERLIPYLISPLFTRSRKYFTRQV